MSNAWDEKKKAVEEQYFEKQNKELLKKMSSKVPAEPGAPPGPEAEAPARPAGSWLARLFRSLFGR